MIARAIAIATFVVAGCGGSSSTPSTSAPTTRPVRVEATSDQASGPRPVRVAPTLAGEAAESTDLAPPPPIEAPTGP